MIIMEKIEIYEAPHNINRTRYVLTNGYGDLYNYIINRSVPYTLFHKFGTNYKEHNRIGFVIELDENNIIASLERFQNIERIYIKNRSKYENDWEALKKFMVLL